MSKHDMGEIAIKLIGLYWLLLAILNASSLLVIPFSDPALPASYRISQAILTCFNVLLYGVAGLFFIKKSEFLLRCLKIPNEPPKTVFSSQPPLKIEELEAFFVCLLALYLTVDAMHQLINSISSYLKEAQLHKLYYQSLNYRKFLPHTISAAAELVVAAFLFFGQRALVSVWNSFRPLAKQVAELRGRDVEE